MNAAYKNKILIVDDEPANIFYLEGFLSEEGFDVITASNGHECIEILSQDTPDVVLLDIMMPEISGIEVLEKMMQDNTLREIPVIMVTAKTSPEDIKEALSIGAIEYIRKPVDEVELLARLKVVLRIKEQEERLKDLLKSRDDFIRIISHDLRTPFTSITGFAQMLYEDEELTRKLTSEHKEFLEHIIKSAEFSVNYFNKLLEWTKLGSSDIKLILKPVDLNKIINTSLTVFMSKIKQKEINIETIISPCNISVDEAFFLQAINNIVSNAIKFTPRGQTIKISNEINNNETIIHIKDSGTGITGISQEELFNKPYHKSKRGTEGEKGSGVGLHICKKILDAHGFTISFESQENKGTTFKIQCPFNKVT